MRNVIICTFAALFSTQLHAYDFQNIAENHILPVYQHLENQAIALDESAKVSCEKKNRNDLVKLRNTSKQAFLAWQGAQHLRFGPIQFLSRDSRFAFWPDKRGVVRKQLYALLQDPALTTQEFDIAEKSVALQGFSALEYLLYTSSSLDDDRCRIVVAITNNIRNMSHGVLEDWLAGNDSYLKYFVNPNSKNLIYKSESELASELLNSFYTQLELIVKQKLGRPLGSGLERARGKSAEAWRSECALAAINENVESLYQLYKVTFQKELDGDALQNTIETAFQKAFDSINKINVPLSSAVADPKKRIEVEKLREDLSLVKRLVTRDMVSQLDLSLGFNSLDGD